jgi:hypothetical protein
VLELHGRSANSHQQNSSCMAAASLLAANRTSSAIRLGEAAFLVAVVAIENRGQLLAETRHAGI